MLLTTHTLNNLIVPYGMKFEGSGYLGLKVKVTNHEKSQITEVQIQKWKKN